MARDVFPPQAVVFDLDGVLLDSFAANVAYYNYIAAGLGRGVLTPFDEQVVHRETHENALLHLAGSARLAEAIQLGRQYNALSLQSGHKMFPQAAEVLAHLHRQVPLAVGTNRDKSTFAILDELKVSQLFQVIVTPSHAPQPKPSAAFMDYLLEQLGLKPQHVVYVGDSLVDEQLCQAAGVRLVAFQNPQLAGWRHVEHFAQLPEVLGLA